MNLKKLLKLIPALALILSLLSAGLILYYIIIYGVDIPYMDQWEYIGFFDHLRQGNLTFEELFRQHNEYRQLFPNLIFVGLGWLTDWNVKYEMIVIFLLACLVSWNVYRLINQTVNTAAWKKWILFFLTNIFIFSPMQWENWLFGVQIEYFIPIACVSTGLVLSLSRMDGRIKLLLCMILAVISTYSSINGFICWIVLFPALYFSGTNNNFFKKWAPIAIWVVATGISLFFYFYGYKKPGAQPSLSEAMNHPLDAIEYLFGTLGNTLRIIHNLDIIIIIGGFLCLIFLAQLLYILLHIRNKIFARNSMIWAMLGMYSFLTAAMLTVGRLGYGTLQSLASRYTSFILYIDIAIILLAAVIIQQYSIKKYISVLQKTIIALLVAFIVFSKVITYPVAVNELESYHTSIEHGKASLLFINIIPYEQCVNRVYPRNFEELHRKANILNSMGYLRPTLINDNIAEHLMDTKNPTSDYGTFDVLNHVFSDFYIASGDAIKPGTNEAADAVLLSYENEKGQSVIFGLNNTGQKRWTWFFTVVGVPRTTTVLRAWAFDASTAKAYPLEGKHPLRKKQAN